MSELPELPELTGQIRVLVIEDDILAAHPVLARCTEAGMDARYAPGGRAAVDAVRETHPHAIVLSDIEGEGALKLGLYLRRMTQAPILVLTHAHSNPVLWRAVNQAEEGFLDKKSSPQTVLERTARMVKNTYHAKQLMISDTPEDGPGQNLPTGWGKCQSCGYLGPRAKFVSSSLLARHNHTCPACKNSDDIVFAVS